MNNGKTIVTLTGANGSGKTRIGEELAAVTGGLHIGARPILNEKLRERGWEENRANQRLISNELRHEHGPQIMAELELAHALASDASFVVMESVRGMPEDLVIRQKLVGTSHRYVMVAVDAPFLVRAKRQKERKSGNDARTLVQLLEDENRELYGDPFTEQSVAECIRRADLYLRIPELSDLRILTGVAEYLRDLIAGNAPLDSFAADYVSTGARRYAMPYVHFMPVGKLPALGGAAYDAITSSDLTVYQALSLLARANVSPADQMWLLELQPLVRSGDLPPVALLGCSSLMSITRAAGYRLVNGVDDPFIPFDHVLPADTLIAYYPSWTAL